MQPKDTIPHWVQGLTGLCFRAPEDPEGSKRALRGPLVDAGQGPHMALWWTAGVPTLVEYAELVQHQSTQSAESADRIPSSDLPLRGWPQGQ